MFPTAEELKERQGLLKQLRDNGDPAALAKADELRILYHHDNMAVLAKDTYFSAAEKHADPEFQKSPPGWVRASENLDLLRDQAPGLARMNDAQLMEYLRPKGSGFRAEIYLPDASVLGPGFKPVIAPKGSSGVIDGKNGKEETMAEDFLANNFPQSVGMKTDFYDRAMRLARDMQFAGLDAEYAGHSLGGGMASAMSAVTGQPATTYNASGLHPDTAARFAQENPGTRVYDTSKIVTSYQISGELLNDGIQLQVHRFDAHRREQMAGVLKEACELLHKVPEGQAALQFGLSKLVPPHAESAVAGFVKKLAVDDTDQLLNELPLAAGQFKPLDSVKTFKDGQLVDRTDWMTLQELSTFAGPVLDTARVAAVGAHMGHRAGEVPAALGRSAAQGLDTTGDLANAASRKVADFSDVVVGAVHGQIQNNVRLGGEGVAKAREVAGAVDATIDTVQGEVQARGAAAGAGLLRGIGGIDVLPDSVQKWVNRNADDLQEAGLAARQQNIGEAQEARREAREDASAIRTATEGRVIDLERVEVVAERANRVGVEGVGKAADTALGYAGLEVRARTQTAPAAGAIIGGTLAGAAQAATDSHMERVHTAVAAGMVVPSGNEAFTRHLMTETVLPSMTHYIHEQERAVRAQFPGLTSPKSPEPAAPSVGGNERSGVLPTRGPDDPSNANHSMLGQIRTGMRAQDEKFGKPYDEGSERISRCLLAACKDNREMHPGKDYSLAANQLNRVDQLVIGPTGNIFAVEGKLEDPASKRAGVSIEQALRTPVEQSDQKLEAATQAIAQEHQRERALAQQQGQQQSGPSRS
ncbi:XVIPCD domain-containing protein [Lysobacter sp. Hz 25]|uniref:XVIPCD domain-containing protein n=1 Tax=Lysobacter sp. Hz 25 TaxID=3383698 RepID=UPI0038D4FD0D